MKSNEQGRSMIEMLGVLAIVGVLSVGGIAGYSKAMAKFKTNKIIDQVTMLSTNIRTMFGTQGDYAGLSNALALKTGTVPGDMYNPKDNADDGKIANAFGGYVELQPSGAATVNKYYFLAATGIPENACVSIATTDWGADATSGLMGMQIVQSGAADTSTTGTAATSSAITSATANLATEISTPQSAGVTSLSNNYAGPTNLPLSVSQASVACKPAANGGLTTIVWIFS